jgi:putative ABC transport system permease protein
MRWLSRLTIGLRTVFRRRRLERELHAELHFHLDEQIAENVAAGMSPEEARRGAHLALGGITQLKEAVGDQSPWRIVDNAVRDVRFAVRSLRRTPVFVLTAAIVLALGIGANATVFTIVNTVLLRPLPFERADDIVQIRRRTPFGSSGSFSMHDYLALTRERGDLSALAILDVFSAGRYTLMAGDQAESINACHVSAGFFKVLGVTAVRGRVFGDGDDLPGRPLTAVITQAFWARRFGEDPATIGRFVTIGGQPHTIVGIVPDVVRAFSAAEVYLSLPVPEASADRTNSFQVLARLELGASLRQAEARLDTIARRHAEASPSLTNMPQGVVLRSLQDDVVAPVRPTLEALMLAVGLVFLIACSNVANLMLARTLTRRRELAVMAALGASRWRIAQRVLTENLVVAVMGGGAGLYVAHVGVRLLPTLSGVNLPQAQRIHIDASMILYVVGITVLAGIVAGMPLVMQFVRGDILRAMKEGGTYGGSRATGHRLRTALTLAQIALSTILLIGAGLLTRSFWNLASVDPGFRVDHVLTMSVSMSRTKYPDSARVAAYTGALARRLERIPGVVAASSTTALPSEFPIDFPVSPVGRSSPQVAGPGTADLDAWYRAIDPHYFGAMGIPLLKGRVFGEDDSAGAAPVIVINQALARAAFPGTDALGRALVIGAGYLTDARDLRPRTIVGIVGDTREQGLRFAPTLTIYVPVAQSPERITQLVLEKIPVRWAIRTVGEPAAVAAEVRQTVLAEDHTQPPADLETLSEVLARSIAPSRFNMLMLVIFGSLSGILAAAGVYGLTAYVVGQRTRELGIRLALGASPTDLVRRLLGDGLRLCLIGTILGLGGALVLSRFLRSLVFGVSVADGPTIVAIVMTMTIVVLTATYLPASRASKIDPVLTLRQD